VTWPDAVERVAAYLRAAGAEAQLEELGAARTAAEAAAAVGCELSRIVKTLVLDCDGRPAAVLVPGDRRADLRKVARELGCTSVRVAATDEVEAATGFPPGGVAPFPLPRVDRVLIDRSLLAHEVVWVGAGSPRHLAGLAPGELVRLARARPVDAVRDAA
jgi:Cys-tRNA(Pro) deacylase